MCAELFQRPLRRVPHYCQSEGNLGTRMAHAFRSMFTAGYKRCVIIGTDCPTLGPSQVSTAFEALRDADLVLGPTADGGYYLIGLRRRPDPALLRGIAWSTKEVLTQTLGRATSLGLQTALLPKACDIDTVADLPPLKRELLARWERGERPFPVRTLRALEWEF